MFLSKHTPYIFVSILSARVCVCVFNVCVLACLLTWVPGENPGVKGGYRRDPLVDHPDHHPDRTAYPCTSHLRTMEGKYK